MKNTRNTYLFKTFRLRFLQRTWRKFRASRRGRSIP